MRPVRQVNTGTGAKAWIPVDFTQGVFAVGVAVDISATATYTLEVTYDDIFDSSVAPTAFTSTVIAAASTADADGTLTRPCRAIRVNIAANTGNVVLHVVQGLAT